MPASRVAASSPLGRGLRVTAASALLLALGAPTGAGNHLPTYEIVLGNDVFEFPDWCWGFNHEDGNRFAKCPGSYECKEVTVEVQVMGANGLKEGYSQCGTDTGALSAICRAELPGGLPVPIVDSCSDDDQGSMVGEFSCLSNGTRYQFLLRWRVRCTAGVQFIQ